MLRIALLFALATVTLGSSLFDPQYNHLWDTYKSLHHKAYSPKEEGVRRLIWEKTLLKIVKHNMEAELGLQTYKLGINQFSDMTDEEFSSLMNSFIEGTEEVASTLDVPPLTKIPDEIDWRKKGLVTRVKNQGKCGSCWAFSVTGTLEGLHKKKTGKLVPLSEQQLVDCSEANHGCSGGNMVKAFEYIIEAGGVVTEASYPYKGKEGKCRFNISNVEATMKEIKRIPRGKEDSLKFAVGHYGPVSVGIHVYSPSMRHYKEGVFVDHKCSSSSRKLNHAVLVVGYGTENGQDYWLVKNSWGTIWGDSGYIKMARNRNNMCGIATFASFPL